MAAVLESIPQNPVTATKTVPSLQRQARAWRVVSGTALVSASPSSVAHITMLSPDAADTSSHRLFIEDAAISRDRWSWNEGRRVLSWSQGEGGTCQSGWIEFTPDGRTGAGCLTGDGSTAAISVEPIPVTYTCELAANAGAYAAGDASAIALKWDTTSTEWKAAKWVEQVLAFNYSIQSGKATGVTTYDVAVDFTDLQTDIDWKPSLGTFTALITSDMRFIFSSEGAVPPVDNRSALDADSRSMASVLPYLFSFEFDPFATSLTGAMLTGSLALTGAVYAVKGAVDNPSIVGAYSLSGKAVSVRGGKLVVGETVVANSKVSASRLTWSGLAKNLADLSGLPADGYLEFSVDGETVTSSSGAQGQRLGAEPPSRGAPGSAASTTPSINDLLNMTQYEQDGDGNWSDVFQQPAMQDFYTILQYYMDPDLLKKYLGETPPALDGTLKEVAAIAGSDGTKPKDWYQTLSVAFLSNALSTSTDSYASKLNALRAQKWMQNAVAASSVYQGQSPLLYQNKWTAKWPETGTFLSDQQANAPTYAVQIQQDANDWKSAVQKDYAGDPDTLNELLDDIDRASQTAIQGNVFWAYTFYRYITQPSSLQLLEAMSLESDLDGSEYSRRVQTNCAVLNVIDVSGAFVKEYIDVIKVFQLGNVLPTLIDYSGNTDEYIYASQQIIEAFIAQYGGSTDPDIKSAVAELQASLQDAQAIAEVIEVFANLASASTGVYGWTQLATTFEEEIGTKLAKFSTYAARMITMACVVSGTFMLVQGFQDWRKLSDEERAGMVVGAVGLFTQAVAGIMKSGATLATIFSTEPTWTMRISRVWSSDVIELANERISGSFGKWLVGNGKITATELPDITQDGLARLTTVDDSIVTKVLGRNLDEFMATRIGAVLAIANLFLSSFELADSKTDTDIAANSLFVASSGLEIFSIAGNWALASAGITEVGGLAVATIASLLASVAALAAVAGIVLILVEMFKKKKVPSVVEDFAKGAAKNAGYYMPYGTDIDEFQVYQLPNQSQQVGIALLNAGDTQACLQMAADGSVKIAPLSYAGDTVFYLSTDAYGKATITAGLPPVSGSTIAQMVTLAVNTDKQVVTATAPVADANQQLWVAEIQGNVKKDGDYLLSADFVIYSVYLTDQRWYLNRNGNNVVVGATPQTWALKMTGMAPAHLSMNDISLHSYSHDWKFNPVLAQPGSLPMKWTLTPSLPSFLQFDPGSGIVSEVSGASPTAFGPQQYSLAVQNDLGSTATTFSIEASAS